jgi:hypothetical protein
LFDFWGSSVVVEHVALPLLLLLPLCAGAGCTLPMH